MFTKDFNLKVDFDKSVSYKLATFVKGDYASCRMLFTTVQDMTKLRLFVAFKMPDDTAYLLEATVLTSTTAELVLPSGVLSQTGRVDCQVALHDTDARLTNAVGFYYMVNDDLQTGAIEASDNLPILTQLIADVEEIIDTVMTKTVYDPNDINDDVFDMTNMVEGTTNKIFTDTERLKLSGIEDGAEVNVVLSVDGKTGAVDLTDDYEPKDSTILKDADIGVIVQAYDANTVIDADYVRTEENYTTLEKSRPLHRGVD